jgi:AraC family transcriptional regulator
MTDTRKSMEAGALLSEAPAGLEDKQKEDDRRALAGDPIIPHLETCLETARSGSSEMCSDCLVHLKPALEAYLRRTQNTLGPFRTIARGGLAPWQLRRAKEMMGSRLDGAVSLAELARVCDLSSGHFARAFKRTTGQSPHHWLIAQRIEKAKQLMTETSLSLAEIACACGFADQSHFTRVFSRATQTTPGVWRDRRVAPPPAHPTAANAA